MAPLSPSSPTLPPSDGAAPPRPSIGVVVISAASILLLAISLGVCALMHNEPAVLLITGCIVTNATSVVGWWIGSSKGSSEKSARLQSLLPAPAEAAQTPPISQARTP